MGPDSARRRVALITALFAVTCVGHASARQAAPTTDSTTRTVACNECLQVPRPRGGGAVQDTTRPHAIVYSNGYATRLTIHRIASYAELPLFAAEYIVGTKVLNDEQAHPGVRSPSRGTHTMIASGLEALFAINTVTGVWNLVESRHDPSGRTRRWIHSIAMLAADAGFVATASSGGSARGGGNSASQHRSLAIASMGVATAATLMMWLWKD